MVIDEQELRHRLKAVAAGVDPPRLNADTLVGRIRRRRARIIALLATSVLAVAAAAVAVPIGLGSGGSVSEVPMVVTPPPLFTVTVNGHSKSFPTYHRPPLFHVRPGEQLSMTVAMTVPRHIRLTALWLGISKGTLGSGPNGPVGMRPILASSHRPLSPGLHTFTLHWRVPRNSSDGHLLLVSAWSTRKPPDHVAEAIAVLVR
jgi:hypothetical protein